MSIHWLEGQTLTSIIAREGAIKAKVACGNGLVHRFEASPLAMGVELVRVQGDIMDVIGMPLIEAKHIYTMGRRGEELTVFVLRTRIGSVYLGFKGDARCATYNNRELVGNSLPSGTEDLPDNFRWQASKEESESKDARRLPSVTPVRQEAIPPKRRLILRKR